MIRRPAWRLAAALLVWLGGDLRRTSAAVTHSSPLLQVVVAENHGVMFCHACDDPLHQGSYVPALSSFFNPSSYFVISELVYAVPNRGEAPLLNVDEVRGRVALFDRGKVSFAQKVQHAQQAGALGVIIIDSTRCDDPREQCFEDRFALASLDSEAATSTTVFEGDPYVSWRGVRIPSVLISAANGERVKSFMTLEVFEIQGETHHINAF